VTVDQRLDLVLKLGHDRTASRRRNSVKPATVTGPI
jgi:hypothetical protein